MKVFPGMSKGQYKGALGMLLREGAVQCFENEMKVETTDEISSKCDIDYIFPPVCSLKLLQLIPEAERKPLEAQPYTGKSPRY